MLTRSDRREEDELRALSRRVDELLPGVSKTLAGLFSAVLVLLDEEALLDEEELEDDEELPEELDWLAPEVFPMA